MIETKVFEVRDSMTYIPVIAVAVTRIGEMNPVIRHMLGRLGFINDLHISVGRLEDMQLKRDPAEHGPCRTMQTAHLEIRNRWHELKSGDVIDVQYILHETDKPKQSEWKERYPWNITGPDRPSE